MSAPMQASKRDSYHLILRSMENWDDYLQAESGLPGPRANLELIQAVADLGNRELFERYIRLGPNEAPVNSPPVFLAVCGVVGLGRLVSEGEIKYLAILRDLANDPRWRVREGVAMALQRIGLADMDFLLEEMQAWSAGSWLEKRATAAAICEPVLLKSEDHAFKTLQLLDRMTGAILLEPNRRSEEFKVFRKGMAYCWSVAVVSIPKQGKQMMEKWISSADPDILWIMKENLKKNRLIRMDPDWVNSTLGASTWHSKP